MPAAALADIEVVAGTVLGTEHARIGRNNQDAYWIERGEDAIAIVVCDGCGSGKHSEVGAQIGARLVATAIAREAACRLATDRRLDGDFWACVQGDVLSALRSLLDSMGGDRQTANDLLLFTIVGAVMTASEAIAFSLGDGVLWVNGALVWCGEYANNAPPYLAYGLYVPEAVCFEERVRLPLKALDTMLLGTDGVQDLMAAADRQLPGKSERVGDIAQFWTEQHYFKHSDGLRRRLAVLNGEKVRPDWERRELRREAGILPDDTTIAVIRNRRAPAAGWEAKRGSNNAQEKASC